MIKKLISGHIVDTENLEQMVQVYNSSKILLKLVLIMIGTGLLMLISGIILGVVTKWVF